MQICILGAGVIGVTAAYRLLESGHDVTLLDALPEAARGASLGNGAQLSYSYVSPLADPSVWTQWPHYLFSRDSPLTLRPQPDPGQWRWLARFLAASTASRVRSTTAALLGLAFLSRDRLAALRAAHPIRFHHRIAGKLVMMDDPRMLEKAARQIAFQARYGCRQQVVDAARCLDIEPVLRTSRRTWAGGVHTADEEVGDCALFCAELIKLMSGDRRFRFVPGARVDRIRLKNGRLLSVSAGNQTFDAESYVLAMGSGSTSFAKMAGFRLPVYPLKGYSITVPLDAAADAAEPAAPRVSITDLSRKIVYARVGNSLRVAGRVELVGHDAGIPRRAVDELVRGTAELFPRCGDLSDPAALSPWTGFRPATPTGLPIIGRSPVGNLYLNVGHGSLGWTLACGSAAVLADLLNGHAPAIDSSPFDYS